MQSFVRLNLTNRDRFFDGVYFPDQYQASSWSEIQPNGKVWLGLWWRVGDDVDFANTQAAETLIIEPNIRYNFGKHLRATLNHTYQQLDVEGGRLFDVNLSQLRLVYQFNVRTFVRATFQYQTVDRDAALYIDEEVDEQSEDLFTQFLFSYKLNPRTVLFFGYSDNREGYVNELETVELEQADRTLFLKIGYAWNL